MVEAVLKELIDTAIGSLPDGGAEISLSEVRAQICGARTSTESWLNFHRTPHRPSLHPNAAILCGRMAGREHRIDYLVRFRELQGQAGGFQTFIPPAFHRHSSQMAHISKPKG